MSDAIIALNRFGLGARPGEAKKIADPKKWLKNQLTEYPPKLSGNIVSSAEVAEAFKGFASNANSNDQDARRNAVRKMARIRQKEVSSILYTRAVTEQPFIERWIAFWSNHLCVSAAGKAFMSSLLGTYEREAIRPYAFARFDQMLLASARHPAMLRYLDNVRSIGPNSMMAQRRGRNRSGRNQRSNRRLQAANANRSTDPNIQRQRQNARTGLNENYARELLELHTVGVNGGYTQKDVEQLAEIFTGWQLSGLRSRDASDLQKFYYQDRAHEPGSKTVMGKTYYENGYQEGLKVIRDLAVHPETTKFISTKIARHFIDDNPPQSAIDKLSATWRKSGGNLRAIAETLIDLDEAWDPQYKKFRTPQDWVIAMMRATGYQTVSRQVTNTLQQMRHEVWAPAAPTGYKDTIQVWADPDSLMNRAELARTFADKTRRDGIDPVKMLDVIDVSEDEQLHQILTNRSIKSTDRLALVFASPTFQWR